MKRLYESFLGMLLVGVIIGGCKTEEEKPSIGAKATNTYVVVVGMENSKFAGSCPGAGYDADRVYNLLLGYTHNSILLKNEAATKNNVKTALENAIVKSGTGLTIFFYSGHGGSEPFANTGIEETDGKDEFLCLWDTWMRDNEIWEILSKSKGRVLMLVDACHSQTMWRSPGFRLTPPLAWEHTVTSNLPFSLLCWSGCPDNTYSYGSPSGGQFTNALLRHYKVSKTYENLWNEIKTDKILRQYEDPQSTNIGNGFEAKSIFR